MRDREGGGRVGFKGEKTSLSSFISQNRTAMGHFRAAVG